MTDVDFDDVEVSCPFCGSVSLLMMDDDGKHYILCLDCRACGPCCDDRMEALVAWTERTDEDATTLANMRAKRLVQFS